VPLRALRRPPSREARHGITRSRRREGFPVPGRLAAYGLVAEMLSTPSELLSLSQGLLSPLILPGPFPWLWFRRMVDRDSGNLVNPFQLLPGLSPRARLYL